MSFRLFKFVALYHYSGVRLASNTNLRHALTEVVDLFHRFCTPKSQITAMLFLSLILFLIFTVFLIFELHCAMNRVTQLGYF